MKKQHLNHKMNGIQRFLMICSGANIHILQKTPSEWDKFLGMGGSIFFTAVYATLSASYAIFTIFDNLWASLFFGILWGLMIFNLDRYIVSSIKKTGGWWKQFLMYVPRLIVAIFLGITISKPLELKVFEKEINKQLNTIIQRNKTKLQKDMNGRILQQSSPFEAERKQINNKLLQYQNAYDSAEIELEKEILGKETGLTSGKAGFGPNAKRKYELKEQRRKDLERYQNQVAPRLEYLDKEISKVYDNIENERKKTEVFEDEFTGFAARSQALEELGNIYAIIDIAKIFIMLMFIFIEISPVFVKSISSVGPYDYILEKIENDFKLYSEEKIEKSNISSAYRIKHFKDNLEI